MTRERLTLYDTTLRDGAQTDGVDFSVDDKRAVMALLDQLGIDVIEAGYPGANPADTALFDDLPTTRARRAAFGMTVRPGRSAANDPGVAALVQAGGEIVTFVAKAWDFHVELALGCTLEENLAGLRASVETVVAAGKTAMVDAEHAFDGYRANSAYALDVVRTALDAGAETVVLCDTNGGTLPDEVARIVAEVIAAGIPGARLGIHAHDDTGHAVANSLAAVRAGVRQVQGTLNGLGERCGNANLITLIPTLLLKPAYAERFETGVSSEALATVTQASRAFDELLNRAPARQSPYVGAAAFATKAGIHASAIIKAPESYEHVEPALVGNARRLLVSNQGGRSNVLAVLTRLGVEVNADDPRVGRLVEEVKAREADGYAYEAAEASFELLARRMLGQVPEFFRVESFRATVEGRFNAMGEKIAVSEAVVKVAIDGETYMSVAEGNGPVNALDAALRKDLGRYQALIDGLELVDFKVRILNGGTGAITRVLIESADETGRRWWTVGVSPNLVEASLDALMDSIVYRLLKGMPAA